MWPFAKRKRREVEQDAEYQAFLDAHQKKPGPPTARAVNPQPNGHWRWDALTRMHTREQLEGVRRAYQGSAVSYGPVDQLSSATYAVYMHESYPDQAND